MIGNLIIKNKNTCNWSRSYDIPIKVFIGNSTIQAIFNYSSGKMSTDDKLLISDLIIHQYGAGNIFLNLDCKNLIIDLNGIGNITLAGKCQNLNARIYNLGFYRFGVLNSASMMSKEVTITSETQVNCFVYADSILNATINDSGNILYTGPAKLIETVNGLGSIIKQL